MYTKPNPLEGRYRVSNWSMILIPISLGHPGFLYADMAVINSREMSSSLALWPLALDSKGSDESSPSLKTLNMFPVDLLVSWKT
jgi:hypothetical protein